MRVSPIDNFNSITAIKRNRKLEKPSTESVQNIDTVSFKGSYESVFRDSLHKKVTTYAEYKELFANLTSAVRAIPNVLISKKIKQYSSENFFWARRHYDGDLDFSKKREEVLFKTRDGIPLLTVNKESIDFYSINNDYKPNTCDPYYVDYIRFSRDKDENLCLSRPLSEIIIWWPSGNLKEDIGYVDHDGRISHHKYYKQDGTPDGWKNFFLGT